MKDLVGLSKTKSFIDSTTLDSFPHSLILLGKEGSGKKEVCNYISNHLNIDLLDITDELSDELISNIYRFPDLRLYMIDVRRIPQNKQNVFLKLFEEPTSNAFVVVLANSKFQLLSTVLNRGTILNLDIYSKEELKDICIKNNISVEDKYIGTLLKTPGDVLKLYSNNVNMDDINDLCDKIVDKLGIASFTNTLTIIDKINFKDEFDKLDLDLLLNSLYIKYIDRYQKTKDKLNLECGRIVDDTIKKLSFDSRLNKKTMMTSMLVDLWILNRENS